MDTQIQINAIYRLLQLACGWAVKTRQQKGKIRLYRLAREQSRRMVQEYNNRQCHVSKHYKQRLYNCIYCLQWEAVDMNEYSALERLYTAVREL